MPDDLGYTPGTGANVATDDCSGRHCQVVKLAYSADGVATHVPADVNGLHAQITKLPWGMVDTFGKLQVVNSLNDIDVQFYRDVPANLVTVAAAGGGTATQTQGMMQLASSTGTTGSITTTSLDFVQYRSGGEVFSIFTYAWLDGGAASSTQYIGLYDANNGALVGYNGVDWGIGVVKGGSTTHTARGSFNVDLLTGAAGSKFTRNGVPEAIDLTKLNLFRIRYGWLGAAPIKYEVASPDGDWVLFHIIRQPNLSAEPHILTSDLPMRAAIVKTAGATNLRGNTACWGAGLTYDKIDIVGSYTLGTVLNSVVNYSTQGVGTIRVRCGTSTTGTIIVEATIDGTNWITHPQVVKTGTGQDLFVVAAETPTAGASYVINASSYRGVRIRTASTLGATVTLHHTGEDNVIMLKTVDMATPPHNFGYAQVSRSVQYTAAQTGTAVWTPASGRRIAITSYQIQSYGTTAGTAILWFGGGADTTYTRNTDFAIFDGEFAPSATNKPGVVQSGVWASPTADFVLRITTTNAQSITVTVWGYEF
jgi:hypothetical protein